MCRRLLNFMRTFKTYFVHKAVAFTWKIKTTLSYFDSTIIFWYSLQAQLYKLLFCADTLVTTFSLCSPNKMLSCDLANSPNIWCCFLTQEHTSQLTQLHIIKSTISRLLCVLVVWQLLTFVVLKIKMRGQKCFIRNNSRKREIFSLPCTEYFNS